MFLLCFWVEFNYLFHIEQQKFKALKFVVFSSYSVEIEGETRRNRSGLFRFVLFWLESVGSFWGFSEFFLDFYEDGETCDLRLLIGAVSFCGFLKETAWGYDKKSRVWRITSFPFPSGCACFSLSLRFGDEE